jgi:hypothetical protein
MFKIDDIIYCGDRWNEEKYNCLYLLSPNKKYKILDKKSYYIKILSDDKIEYWYQEEFFISKSELRKLKLKTLKKFKPKIWTKFLK